MPDVSLSSIEFVIKGDSDQASSSVNELRKRLDQLSTSLSKASGVSKLSSNLRDVGNAANDTAKKTNNFLSSIMRIAKYRMIRSAIRAVTSAFQEGLKNAYQFSKMNSGALAESLDQVATASLTMKNQLGAAFGGLLTAITPIILQIIALVTRLASALSMLFAALGGQSQYKAAVDVWTEWGEAAEGAGGAAKEALKYLAPFDELNVLPSQKQGGGGGGDMPDFEDMFEYQDLPEWLQGLAEKMSELVESLKITFDDIVFDWSDLTGEQIAEKVIAGLGGLLGAAVGFMIGGVPGAVIGTLLGVGISAIISSMIFDHDGVIDANEAKELLSLALTALTGGVIGFMVGGPGGALFGATIGIGIWGALQAFDFFTDFDFDLTQILLDSILPVAGGAIGFVIGGPGGAAIGATLGLGLTFWLENFVFGDTSEWTTEDWIRNIVEVLAPVAGAAIGFAVGGPGGALLGATIGLSVSFSLEGFSFGDSSNWNTNDWIEHIVAVIAPLAGALIGFVVGGPAGALIGATIGLGINFLISSEVGGGDLDSVISWGKSAKEKFKEGWDSVELYRYDEEITLPVTAEVTDVETPDNLSIALEGAITAIEDKIQEERERQIELTATIIDLEQRDPTLYQPIKSTAEIIDIEQRGLFDVDTSAHLTKVDKSGLSSKDKTIGVTAQYKWVIKSALSELQRSLGVTAIYKWVKKGELSNDQRSLGITGVYKWVTKGLLTEAQKTINTISQYTKADKSKLTGAMTTVNTTSKYTKTDFSALTAADREVNTKALIKSTQIDSSINYGGKIKVDAIINITDYTGLTAVDVPKANGGVFTNSGWKPITSYAGGGFPYGGQIFRARENGNPELVGTLNGSTAVMNNNQIVASVSAGVARAIAGIRFQLRGLNPQTYQSEDGVNEDILYRAFSRALADADLGGDIELDGEVLYRSMVNRNRRNTRMTGVNALG